MLALALSTQPALFQDKPIDRKALVSRHNVVLNEFNTESPLQVGNGEFAFGMDLTGLQTFVPFNTMSQWGWHTSALPPGQKLKDFEGDVLDTHGRMVRYPLPDPKRPALSDWMTGNPHRINLGRIGLLLKKKDGTLAAQQDIKNAKQELDLWTGIVTSNFEVEGTPVKVTTACHPTLDLLAVNVESPLVKSGRLEVFIACPGNNGLGFANYVGDWSRPGKFIEHGASKANRADYTRQIDADVYSVSLAWQGKAQLLKPQINIKHAIKILKAEYGAGDKWIDVATVVRQRTEDECLILNCNNEIVGSDPAPKVVKTLKVHYTLDGKELTAEAREGDDLRIDPVPERRRITLQPGQDSNTLSFVCGFAPKPLSNELPDANKTFTACRRLWPAYWKSGGAIDLSQSKDPRWKELERRIVLSQYLMKVNEAGSLPPQESGLVNNGWFGRFHMEMVWWHATHWALWNRWPELNKGIGIYDKLLPGYTKLATSQGYKGARWPKCIGNDLREWPFIIHATLIWQQPHPIFFAELDYRAHPNKATLKKWWPVIEASADFMASYAYFDPDKKQYVLGPPVFVASENTDPITTQNPTFELGYWRFGLRTAQEWRKRMGMAPNAEWDKVLQGLSPLPQQEGLYVLHEGVKDMWTKFAFEHPAITGTFGLLPGDGVDKKVMRLTLDKIMKTWNWDRTWGWDFPMLAMCAARLGETDRAIDLLLTSAPGFQFDARGLATGGPFPYFPSNGGLLYTVAMMAAGWDGSPKTNAPGFPSDGRWKVRYENLNPAP